MSNFTQILGLLSENAFLVVAALFPIVNPIGATPIFSSLTRNIKGDSRKYLVRKIAINSIIITVIAMVFGSYILKFFGISEAAVRVGGGFLVISTAWRLLNAEQQQTEVKTNTEEFEPMSKSSVASHAFYPLTFPLSIGPGAISVSITLGARMKWNTGFDELISITGAGIGILMLGAIIYLCYSSARRLTELLGESGAQVMSRLSAFILLCIGVQITWEGVKQLFL